jgi:hypothetical protein
MTDARMSKQLCRAEPVQNSSPTGTHPPSDVAAEQSKSVPPDFCLISSDGTRYPVHKATLAEQSVVLRRAQ